MNSTQTAMEPGARAGQIILLVELSLVEQPDETLDLLRERGYNPTLCQCSFKTGARSMAVLKDEQFDPTQEIEDGYLMDEWEDLTAVINRDAVRLWRGHPKREPIAA